MIKIAKRTNKTRAAERPPLAVSQASFAILAEMSRAAAQSRPRSAAPLRHSRKGHAQAGKPVAVGSKSAQRGVPNAAQAKPTSQATNVQPAKVQAAKAQAAKAGQRDGHPAGTYPALFRSEHFAPQRFLAPARVLASEPTSSKTNGSAYPHDNGNNHAHDLTGQLNRQAPRLSTDHEAPKGTRPGRADARPVDGEPVDVDTVEVERPQPEATNPEPHRPESSRSEGVSPDTRRPQAGEPAARPISPEDHRAKTPRADLENILKQHPDMPDQAMLLGVCADGLPVLLDLNDPTPGAVLVMSDERETQLAMLRLAVASLAARNSPRQVQFLVLSCDPQNWQNWIAQQGFERYSIAVESAEDDVVRDWVLRLADWTEQRRLGERGGPAVLLVMDTLSFLPRLEYDVRLNFEWMAKEGPQAAIWPLAAISTDLAKALSGRRLLRAFKTRILGYAGAPEDYGQMMGLNEQPPAELNQPGQYTVRAGEDWLHFRLPGA